MNGSRIYSYAFRPSRVFRRSLFLVSPSIYHHYFCRKVFPTRIVNGGQGVVVSTSLHGSVRVYRYQFNSGRVYSLYGVLFRFPRNFAPIYEVRLVDFPIPRSQHEVYHVAGQSMVSKYGFYKVYRGQYVNGSNHVGYLASHPCALIRRVTQHGSVYPHAHVTSHHLYRGQRYLVVWGGSVSSRTAVSVQDVLARACVYCRGRVQMVLFSPTSHNLCGTILVVDPTPRFVLVFQGSGGRGYQGLRYFRAIWLFIRTIGKVLTSTERKFRQLCSVFPFRGGGQMSRFLYPRIVFPSRASRGDDLSWSSYSVRSLIPLFFCSFVHFSCVEVYSDSSNGDRIFFSTDDLTEVI